MPISQHQRCEQKTASAFLKLVCVLGGSWGLWKYHLFNISRAQAKDWKVGDQENAIQNKAFDFISHLLRFECCIVAYAWPSLWFRLLPTILGKKARAEAPRAWSCNATWHNSRRVAALNWLCVVYCIPNSWFLNGLRLVAFIYFLQASGFQVARASRVMIGLTSFCLWWFLYRITTYILVEEG